MPSLTYCANDADKRDRKIIGDVLTFGFGVSHFFQGIRLLPVKKCPQGESDEVKYVQKTDFSSRNLFTRNDKVKCSSPDSVSKL